MVRLCLVRSRRACSILAKRESRCFRCAYLCLHWIGAAYTDYRARFFGKSIYLGLGLLPPLVPILILGVAILFFLSGVGLSGGVHSIVISHVVLCIPFAFAVIRLRLGQVNPALEQAAWNLGAGPWRTMMYVILPLCRPAIVAALLVTASISFDEFAVAWFVSGLNETFPVGC